jgi:hypothetical protein
MYDFSDFSVQGINYMDVRPIVESNDEDSMLCRNIISWYVRRAKEGVSNVEFGFTELGNWLLEKHMPFINEFADSKVPKSYRLHSKRTYIQNRINHLIDLGIIRESRTTKAEKNSVNTPLYKFTIGGVFLAWLLEAKYTKGQIRSEAINRAFEVLPTYFDFYNSYSTHLFSNFLRRCIEKGTSTIIDNHLLLETLHVSITYMVLLVSRPLVLFRLIFSIYKESEVQKLFIDTIHELDKKIQEIILLQLKLGIESEYTRGFHHTEELERMQYDNITNYEKVVILVYCGACFTEYPVGMNILDFLKLPYVVFGVSGSPFKIPQLNCRRCGKPNTINLGPKPKKPKTKAF